MTPSRDDATPGKLDELRGQLPKARAGSPPLHLWQPEYSGDIDIVIHRDGHWSHEGSPIRRESLVRLFASILRREADGNYYLVTPVEKWRIQVEALPLLIVDFDLVSETPGGQQLQVVTNTGERYPVGRDYPLIFPDAGDPGIPAVALDHGITAQFNRATWYRLVAESQERGGVSGILSDDLFFPLEPG